MAVWRRGGVAVCEPAAEGVRSGGWAKGALPAGGDERACTHGMARAMRRRQTAARLAAAALWWRRGGVGRGPPDIRVVRRRGMSGEDCGGKGRGAVVCVLSSVGLSRMIYHVLDCRITSDTCTVYRRRCMCVVTGVVAMRGGVVVWMDRIASRLPNTKR